jgi:hypothetical protein
MKPPPRTTTRLGASAAQRGASLAALSLACSSPASSPSATAFATAPAPTTATVTATAPATVTDAAPAPATATSASGTVVAGRVARIVLQNVSKAQGRYNYNVSLVVEGAIEGAWPFASPRPTRYEVRVDKVYFGELDDAARAALAPEGPKEQLTPARYGRYAVGEDVRLNVKPSSPDIGWLEAP